jgi:hypothetical protein
VRVNVYAEELTSECELVKKTAETGTTFYGLRFYLKSPPDLHNSASDDDRSAITLWVPWTKRYGHDFAIMTELLSNLGSDLAQAITDDNMDRALELESAVQPEVTLNPNLERDLARTISKALSASGANAKDRLINEIAAMLGVDEEDVERGD